MNILSKGNMFLSVSRCFCKSCGETPNVRMGDLAPEVNNFIYRCLRDLWEAESWDRITLPDGSVAISKREVFGWFTPAREVLFEDLQLPARPAVTPNKIAESLRKHLDSSPRRSGRGKT